jgi:hypothetical protein
VNQPIAGKNAQRSSCVWCCTAFICLQVPCHPSRLSASLTTLPCNVMLTFEEVFYCVTSSKAASLVDVRRVAWHQQHQPHWQQQYAPQHAPRMHITRTAVSNNVLTHEKVHWGCRACKSSRVEAACYVKYAQPLCQSWIGSGRPESLPQCARWQESHVLLSESRVWQSDTMSSTPAPSEATEVCSVRGVMQMLCET